MPPDFTESVFCTVPTHYSVEKVKQEALQYIEDFPKDYTSSFLLGVSPTEILFVEFVNFVKCHSHIENLYHLGQTITIYLVPYVDSHKKRKFDQLLKKESRNSLMAMPQVKNTAEFTNNVTTTNNEVNDDTKKEESKTKQEPELQEAVEEITKVEIPIGTSRTRTRSRSRNVSLMNFRKVVEAEKRKTISKNNSYETIENQTSDRKSALNVTSEITVTNENTPKNGEKVKNIKKNSKPNFLIKTN